jgi:glyoxylase-like metal-dependent hydrolase (beta-lactamase superfamily II)
MRGRHDAGWRGKPGVDARNHGELKVKQTFCAAGILMVIVSTSLAMAQDGDFSKAGIKVTKVAGSVYVLEGPASNIGVSSGADGIVLVDDGVQSMVSLVRSALKSISGKPIRYVINTHDHEDHSGGNADFQKDAAIIAHENVRKRLQSGGPSGTGGALRFDVPPGSKDALPTLTFDESITVHLNGEDIRVVHFPNAHTGGDSMVFFPQSNVVDTGDIFVNGVFPFVDVLGGGRVDGLIAACEKLIAQSPANVKVIPGHGPVSGLDDVRGYVAMIKATRAIVAKQIRAGKTPQQMKAAHVLEHWQQLSGPFVDANAFIDILYNDLMRYNGAAQ